MKTYIFYILIFVLFYCIYYFYNFYNIYNIKNKVYFCYYVSKEYQNELKKLRNIYFYKNINLLYCVGDDIPVDEFIYDCHMKIKDKNSRIIFFYAGHSFGYYLRYGNNYLPIDKVRKALEVLNPLLCVFDSCSMGTLESIYEFKNCTKYMLCCQAYGSNDGFLTDDTLDHLNEYFRNNDIILLGKRMLMDAYKNNKYYKKAWSGSLYDMKYVSQFINSITIPDLYFLPYIYDNYPLVDVGNWFQVDVSPIVIFFKKNEKESKDCTGISFISFLKSERDLSIYSRCNLYKDMTWVKDVHRIHDYDKRILYINKNINLNEKLLKAIKNESEVDEIDDINNINVSNISKKIIFEKLYVDLENKVTGIIRHIRNE